jgi:hypothetical protein
MAIAEFFDRVYGAVGAHLSISRESLLEKLKNVSVGIKCATKLNENDAWIAELCTNVLSRLYPRLAVSADVEQSRRLRDLARNINRNIEFIDEAAAETTISIGRNNISDGIYPKANGWVAGLERSPTHSSSASNPYAAGAAAALACAELFRRVFLDAATDHDVFVSLLDFGRATGADQPISNVDVGGVLFAGVGAIGNGALWAIARHANLRGKILLVDGEHVTLSNLQRYVLTTYKDVGQAKVRMAEKYLAGTKLGIQSKQTRLERLFANSEEVNVSTIVVSVDNVEGRRIAQALLPRLVVNGWTGEAALGASWHVMSRNAACLACLYHPHGPGLSATEQAARAFGLDSDRAAALWVTRQPLSDTDLRSAGQTLGVDDETLEKWKGQALGDLYTAVVCGAAPVDVRGLGKVEMVPLAHQSLMAGILMAAELIKRSDPALAKLSQPEPLVSWDDVLKAPPSIWRKPRAREAGCICGDSVYQEVYAKKWGSNVMESLSGGALNG